MKGCREWTAERALPDYPPNLAAMLRANARAYDRHAVYQEVRQGAYMPLSWRQLRRDIASIQCRLGCRGFNKGDRVAILSRNRQEALELELAVMASGGVAVPIFAGYPPARADALVRFCEPRFVAVADQEQLAKLGEPASFAGIIAFDSIRAPAGCTVVPFSDLLGDSAAGAHIRGREVFPETVGLMMYTSGTMGMPKCVQLTHRNILSQQAGMQLLWQLSHRDRFLSYLPWHHSFGGIFEKYAALSNGAILSLEHGYGKNIDLLIENWRRVRPTVFFSVPRIYQELVTRALQDADLEGIVFHPELRFIFTAAAPLPQNLAEAFLSRGIPIIEGWGLTETSPCCTVTDPDQPRAPGLVGKPIPGVSLRLADDGEILVKGPNVMAGYFKNPEATRAVLRLDGWLRTGDVGEFTERGLRLISRKDRIFKLTNAKKVVPTEIENLITGDCAYLAHAFVAGAGKDYPVVLLFPNRNMFSRLPEGARLKERCRRPRTLEEFARCLKECLGRLNASMDPRYWRLHFAMLLDRDLTIENDELTPSMKVAPNVVATLFKAHIESLYGGETEFPEGVYVIPIKTP